MVERVMRVRCAISPSPSASDGSSACQSASARFSAGSAKPLEGSQPSVRANSRISTIPQKKSGRLMPTSAALRGRGILPAVAMNRRPDAERHRADQRDRHRHHDDQRARLHLLQQQRPIGTLNISDWPKSPVSMPPIQRPYCTTSGSSRPSDLRRPASAAGLLCVPMIIIATSPGRMLVTAKVMTEIRNSVSDDREQAVEDVGHAIRCAVLRRARPAAARPRRPHRGQALSHTLWKLRLLPFGCTIVSSPPTEVCAPDRAVAEPQDHVVGLVEDPLLHLLVEVGARRRDRRSRAPSG